MGLSKFASLLGVQEVCFNEVQLGHLASNAMGLVASALALLLAVMLILLSPIYISLASLESAASTSNLHLASIEALLQSTNSQLTSIESVLTSLDANTQKVFDQLLAIDQHLFDYHQADSTAFYEFNVAFSEYADQQHRDMLDLASIEVNIDADDLNITIDIADLDATTKRIDSLLHKIYDHAEAGWASAMYGNLANITQSSAQTSINTKSAANTLEATFNGDSSWAHKTLANSDSITQIMKTTFEADEPGWAEHMEQYLKTVSEILTTTFEVEEPGWAARMEEATTAIQTATEATAEALAEGFRAKVVEVIDSTEWDINMPDFVLADSQILGLEFAAMECAACEGGGIGVPMACEGCAIELVEVEGIDGEELNGPASQITSIPTH